MTQLQQAFILITGASGGFGQEFCRQLLALDGQLILTDIHGPTLEQQAAILSHSVSPGKILACLTADLASRDGCDSLYQQIQGLGYPVDVLINNAGRGCVGRLDEVPAEQWEQLMQVNLLAPMRLSALFANVMVQRRRGHIVNLSSLAGWIAPPGLVPYAASKFGLRGFSQGLARELAPYRVQVTAVYPGFSRTPILQSPRYGSLAGSMAALPDWLVSEPASVIRATIRAIQRNQRQVFPDRVGPIVQRLQRFTPGLVPWLSHILDA
ncbi:short-chain dehydrogenase family oxidoreductase [Halomicronema hongdechloris C2206]|uniref:Short-chain dehydrogenase family oxidoreductase n=1 Tax=Halomicronema hongdechloris C2206 TaxID=1641165 RepID=A0A1Z3HNK5_9CYAN|nr:SDR family NAD(P)-dependent oxidoreductase [Halomicronema hongdechloris]ASC71860.1 short-chain dehydrogenase family oxidoreductase [Halomicronema hongdechloris C2206]